MEKQDNLRRFMKELPGEGPSENFTKMVMDRVNLERKNTPVVYLPLISRQGWWKITLGIIFLVIGVAVVWSYFPGNEAPSLLQPLYSLDFSSLLKPFNFIAQVLNRLSPALLAGLITIAVLLFIDQLATRMAHQ